MSVMRRAWARALVALVVLLALAVGWVAWRNVAGDPQRPAAVSGGPIPDFTGADGAAPRRDRVSQSPVESRLSL